MEVASQVRVVCPEGRDPRVHLGGVDLLGLERGHDLDEGAVLALGRALLDEHEEVERLLNLCHGPGGMGREWCIRTSHGGDMHA